MSDPKTSKPKPITPALLIRKGGATWVVPQPEARGFGGEILGFAPTIIAAKVTKPKKHEELEPKDGGAAK